MYIKTLWLSAIFGALVWGTCAPIASSAPTTLGEFKAKLSAQLEQPQDFIAAAPQALGISEHDPKAAIIKAHLSALLTKKGMVDLLVQALPGKDDRSLTDDEATTLRTQLYQIALGTMLRQVRDGLLRLDATSRKRLFIYDLSQVNYLDDDSCSSYLSGGQLLPPKAYASGVSAFYAAMDENALTDYFKLIEKALQAELDGTPAPATLTPAEEIQGKMAFNAALDYFLQHNPNLRPTMGKVLLKPHEASAAERCLVSKSLMLVLLSIKGEPGNLALLTSLKQDSSLMQAH